MIGLGCMRLSTPPTRDPVDGVAVIHAALDAGATLLDSADVYGLDQDDVGHNERLIAQALASWKGPAHTIEVATKGGLTRPGGRWVPDGRAAHLRSACEASRRALAVESIDLYQLHAVDPRTPIDTSVRALAALQSEGKINRIGLCNVTVSQIEAARAIVDIATVQVSLSPFDDDNLRNGVAEYCRDHDIGLIAYRPLGGERAAKLSRDPVFSEIGAEHDATAQEIALAWLLDLDPRVVPIPGATRVATAQSLARVLALQLSEADRARLETRFPASRMLRVPRARRQPPAGAKGEVLLVMGLPGAGKSSVAEQFVARGYARLNRDSMGGTLSGLVTELERGLAGGQTRWVLDNTYPTRQARNQVIEAAWRHGVPVRCVWLGTSVADAQINAVIRLIEAQGSLPSPEELRARGKSDHRYFGPDAQFRYERQLEPPTVDEGFSTVERTDFARRVEPGRTGRAVIIEYDDVLSALTADLAEQLRSMQDRGWRFLSLLWRPELSVGTLTEAAVAAELAETRARLGLDLEFAVCPHPAGPPVCWCRKPMPGHVIEFAHRHGIALERSILIGRAPADQTLAKRLGLTYHTVESIGTITRDEG